MRWITEAWRRIRSVARRAHVEQRLDEELRFHAEQQTEKNLRAGMAPDEARRRALIAFGGVERAKETTRDEFRSAHLEDVLRDIRYAVRSLRRTPGVALVTIVSLAIGIGATTAVYSAVDWLLNRPPGGVVDPARLVTLQMTDGQRTTNLAFTQYEAIRDVQDVFSDLAVHAKIPGVISTDTRADQVVFEFVTGNYFAVFGLRPTLGRLIGPDDDAAGVMPSVVLSHAFWQSRFGGDPAIVGGSVTLNNDQRCHVIGVLPPGFEGYPLDRNGPSSVWLPVQSYPVLYGGSNMLTRIGQAGIFFSPTGRLRSGVSIETAEARAQPWVPLLTTMPGDQFQPSGFVAIPTTDFRLRPSSRDATRSFFGVLLVVCALVLLAACFNTANFLIGRAASRRREMAVRTALGATRGRLARLLFIEALVIGLSASAVGIIVAVMLIRLSPVMPHILTFLVPVTMDGVIDSRMATVAVALGLLSAIVFGAIPAALVSARNPITDLKHPKPGWSWSGVRISTRQVLLVLQVALAVALASTAGLYAHSLAKIAAIDSGYESPEHVLVARVVPYGVPAEQIGQFNGQLFSALDAMPGVASASIGALRPYSISRTIVSLPERQGAPVETGYTTAAPRFFQTLGVRVAAGREFDGSEADLRDGVIVNQILADHLWPNQSAVGQRLAHGQDVRTVIGVVAEQRCRSLLSSPEPCMYQPFPAGSPGYLFVRVESDPMAFVSRLRALIRDFNPHIALAEERTLADHLRNFTAAQRTSATTTMALAVIGIVLLAAGCVSLFVSMVRDSSREIAIRMALGSTGARLVRRILCQGIVLTIAGLAVGLIATRAVAMRIADQLHEVSAWDPLTWVTASALIVLVCLASVHMAAIRAARTDPVEVLRAP